MILRAVTRIIHSQLSKMGNILKNKFIPKDKLKDWTQYSNNLSNYPLVKKYLSYILKKWVENLQNPLEIQWIESLWNVKWFK